MRQPSHAELETATAARACPTCEVDAGQPCRFAPWLSFIVLAVHAARLEEVNA